MKISRPIAFTLTELIVASVVISVIMLGVVSSNTVLQKNSKDFTNSHFVIQRTSTTLNHVLNAASRMQGNVSNPGFAMGTAGSPVVIGQDGCGMAINAVPTGDANTFCFYIEKPDLTFGWRCYTYDSPNIYWCDRIAAGTCSSGTALLGTAVKLTPSFSINACDDAHAGCTTTASCTQAIQKVLFEITVGNCLDAAQPNQCINASGASINNPNNPYVEKSGGTSPAGHSSG